MKILNLPRQGGKTLLLAKWVKAKPNRILVVENIVRKDKIVQDHGVDKRQIVVRSFDTPNQLRGRAHDSEIALDDAETYIERLIKQDLGVYTVAAISGTWEEFTEADIASVTDKNTSLSEEDYLFFDLSRKFGMLKQDQVERLLGIDDVNTLIAGGKISYFSYQGEKYFPNFMFYQGSASGLYYRKFRVYTGFECILKSFHAYSNDDNRLFKALNKVDMSLLTINVTKLINDIYRVDPGLLNPEKPDPNEITTKDSRDF